MAWISLFVAGLLETAWAAGLKALSGSFSFGLVVATAAAMLASIWGLYWSLRSLPLGVAYPIWTGLGSVGSVVVGVLVFKQEISLWGILGIIFLILGMFLVSLETH